MNPPLTTHGSARTVRAALACLVAVLALVLPTTAWAASPKQAASDLDQRAFFKPELYISSSHVPLADIQSQLANGAAWNAFFQSRAAAEGSDVTVYIDPRSGAASNIIGSFPLIPGRGRGNTITLAGMSASLGRPVRGIDAEVVAALVRRFVVRHKDVLGIDPSQLGAFTATQVNPDLWQVSAPQQVGGVPVRFGRLAASISHGNLVVIGTETWGNAVVNLQPDVDAEFARQAGFDAAAGRSVSDVMLQEPALEVIPVAALGRQQGEGFAGPVGTGYEHRLVWSYVFQRLPEGARWEVLVDAHSGEVLALQDINHYVQRKVTGGAYPLTSTEICPDADHCGTMQLGSPMPFANTGLAAPNNFANSAGVFDWTSGNVTTTFSGRYVRMVDSCGAMSVTAAGDVLLGGANGQHDCTVPTGSSAGNTPASRSGFYELNKLIEQARGWLPTNTWLNGQLTSNMNLTQTCNAFWNGSTVNFYRSGGGCRNTGELAAVFDHEWGHGMDDNDAAGALSNSSEGYADIAAIYRLEASCVGHGFFWTLDDGCGQTPDGTGFNVNEAQQGAAHCATDCSGVRDADYLKHTPNTPDTALGYVCTSCITGTGPCGRQVHCAAAPTRQAAWDLVARDLPAAGYDSQSAFLVGNRLFYQGSGNIGAWHACTCGGTSSGCGATNGYMQWITADDDNGNLNDGTPHMTAIFNAYDRHGIACATPTATNSGCAGGPSGPVSGLTATPGNYQVALNWSAASGATRYWVFRSEGHAGCNFGKALVAEVAGTTYTDTQVDNGRTYYYNVVPVGASSACYGRAGTCLSVVPGGTPTPDFSLSCSPSSLSIQQGNSAGSTCTVTSTNGFNAAVGLDCTGAPAGVTCGYVPASVTPPANGTANSALTVTVAGSVAPGSYSFQARGIGGSLTRTATISLTVTAIPVPNFSVSCAPSSLSVQQGSSGASTCTVTSTNGFNSAVALDCAGQPAGVTCGYNPASVTPPANGSANSALTVTVAASTATGTYTFQARGTSGTLVRTANLTLTVTGTGGGMEQAVFDAALQAPRCSNAGSGCDTGASLVLGRDGRGPEPNQPNTINDSCLDGTLGTYHVDESNDRLSVATLDGSQLAPGKTVRITATVWAYSSFASDKLDLYYAANASAPTWTFLTTLTPTGAGIQTLSATYVLPSGSNVQAVRAQFRYLGSASACTSGSYNDRDDLVFAVAGPPPGNDVTAAFDATLRAPRCATVGRSCTATSALLNGRGTVGPEPNQPNTLSTSAVCTDGVSGTYHVDESNDALKIETVDGSNFGAGKQVRVTASVWVYSSFTSDALDLYYAANANAPVWTLIGTFIPPGAGARNMTATYTLPAGSLQAIRAQFRYLGSASSCTAGAYNDRDDLVFPVQ